MISSPLSLSSRLFSLGELDIPPGMIIVGTNVKADSGRFFIAETRSLPPQLRAPALLEEGRGGGGAGGKAYLFIADVGRRHAV